MDEAITSWRSAIKVNFEHATISPRHSNSWKKADASERYATVVGHELVDAMDAARTKSADMRSTLDNMRAAARKARWENFKMIGKRMAFALGAVGVIAALASLVSDWLN